MAMRMLQDANLSEPISLSDIMREVHLHGFYMAHCVHVAPQARNRQALILAIKRLAMSAQLKVSFNEAQSICIFEALTF